ncbi:MAG: type III pantothenate kinase [Oscillospiraceae bacterium]|nr:type III pantothenate kinase [Oscillospiraceae bacterium]
MLLTIDAGNTNLTLASYHLGASLPEDRLVFHSRMATDRSQTPDQLAVAMLEIFRLHGVERADCTDAVIGSVVSEMTDSLAEAATLLTGRKPLVLAPGVKTGLNIRIDNPAQLGADLIAGAVAAKALYPLPCLVVDLGTATKISALGADGAFLGCCIAPGIAVSLEALSARTSQLPRVALRAPANAIGTDSVTSMQSGTVFGTAHMIDGLLGRMERELGAQASVVATGGLSGSIVCHCARAMEHNEDLVLLGLKEIYRRNRM